MSNIFTASVRLCSDPESKKLGEREACKLRVADNTGSRNEARFINVLLTGRDAETGMRLRSGDRIIVSGQLIINSYTAKKAGKHVKKGEKVMSDEMPFAHIMEVTKSESFFNDAPTEAAEAEEADTSAPDLDGDDPLADL